MKYRLTTTIIASLCAVLALAQEATPVRRPRRRPARPSAGILERREPIPSKQIDVFNMQKSVDEGVLAAATASARIKSSLPLKIGDTKSPARVEIVESDAFGALAVYPENFRAQVNVKPLLADGAAPETIKARLTTELARAAMFLMGSGSVSYRSLTMPVKSLADLDSLASTYPGAEEMMHLSAGKTIGVKPIVFCSYDMACREGWAPPPTNDIQRAVWEQIKADKERGPTNPILIPPPNQKK